MRKNRPTVSSAAALLVSAVLAAAPAAAQDESPAAGRPATAWSWGLRGGVFEMVNSPDAYDAVFGDPMPRLGVQLEADWRARWRVAASVDYGVVEGERVLLTDPPIGTGVDEELTMVPLHLTLAYRFRPTARWDLYAGLGPSLLDWTDETDFDEEGGTDPGGSVVLGLRRQPPDARWRFGGELRWSTFPGAFPESGAAGFFDEDDPGGVSLTFLALRRF